MCSYEAKERNPIWKCDCPNHVCGPRPTGGVHYQRHALYNTQDGVLKVRSKLLKKTVEDIFLRKEFEVINMDSDSESESQSSDDELQEPEIPDGKSESDDSKPPPKRRKSVQEVQFY